ncbi:unnamed protein product [Diamesa tonsa]
MDIEEENPEYKQRKLYFLVENLKDFHSTLDVQLQMRIPNELMVELANCLIASPTVFTILNELKKIQNATEAYFMNLRTQEIDQYNKEIEEWNQKNLSEEELLHTKTLLKIQHERKLKEMDIKCIIDLDENVKEQQTTLMKANVPGFFETTNPQEVLIQMHLCAMIFMLQKLNV